MPALQPCKIMFLRYKIHGARTCYRVGALREVGDVSLSSPEPHKLVKAVVAYVEA